MARAGGPSSFLFLIVELMFTVHTFRNLSFVIDLFVTHSFYDVLEFLVIEFLIVRRGSASKLRLAKGHACFGKDSSSNDESGEAPDAGAGRHGGSPVREAQGLDECPPDEALRMHRDVLEVAGSRLPWLATARRS